jgi:hypothetical protein
MGANTADPRTAGQAAGGVGGPQLGALPNGRPVMPPGWLPAGAAAARTGLPPGGMPAGAAYLGANPNPLVGALGATPPPPAPPAPPPPVARPYGPGGRDGRFAPMPGGMPVGSPFTPGAAGPMTPAGTPAWSGARTGNAIPSGGGLPVQQLTGGLPPAAGVSLPMQRPLGPGALPGQVPVPPQMGTPNAALVNALRSGGGVNRPAGRFMA